jgi:arsenate reductase (glutaredoxin)
MAIEKFKTDNIISLRQRIFMDKVYYLSTCDTCRKILASLPKNNLELHDIKAKPLTEKEVDLLAKMAGSYEALFSRRAERYKSYGLKDQNLTEADFKKYLLDHYTFLSRPVFVINGKIYVGNSKKNVENVIASLR